MRYPNTAPISGAEKGWGVLLAVLSAAIGLIVLIGLLLNQKWARWLGLLLAVIGMAAWAVAAAVLFMNRDSAAALAYPFYPWFIILAGLFAVLCLLAAWAFLARLRSADTEE
jgi:hypothetical protein